MSLPETSSDALPDFLIVGAMKCGTTTLATQLAHQPGVFMTTPKEPNFFSDDEVWARGAAWYRGLFAAAAPGDLRGEASTHYTKLPTHPETLARMAGLVSAPKIVYMIRNPVERTVSHYIHEWSQGTMSGDPVTVFAHHPELVEYGCYGLQIAPYVDRFGAEAVLLTSLEQLTAAPAAELGRIGAFLGRRLAWRDDLGAQNVSAERSRRLPLHGLLVDNRVAEALRRTLVPKSVRTAIRQGRRMTDRPELPATLREAIEGRFAEDRAVLAALFPGHPALDLCYPFLR
jgi:hypothetical protein